MLTIDTLRPDALGWVAGRNATPAIDALAATALRFPRAQAPAPLTLPSHVSMMTALSPRGHGIRDNGRILPASGPATLAERLRDEGYATAAFVSGFPLAASFGLDRGFAHYDDRFPSGPRDRLERSADATASAALAWASQPPPASPWFLWIHFYDPHDPYGESPASGPDGLRAAYDAEVRAVDRAIGRLVVSLPTSPGGRLTVIAADHGESLGDHGEATHGFFVYQSTIEVPLLFSFPGRLRDRESDARVRLIDVAPTVLDLFGLAAWSDREGVSLAKLAAGGAAPVPPTFVESRRPWHSYGWSPLEAVIDGRWKLIAAPRPELFDLEVDPDESENRVDTERRVARRLEGVLRSRPSPASARVADDPETIARLRALGYAGGAGGTQADPPAGLPDPKDRIGLWNRLGEAEADLGSGRADQALAGFDRVLAVEPANPFALARSAEALLASGRTAEAEVRLRTALQRAPDQAEIRRALLGILTRERRFAEAVPHWMELARQRPRDADAWQGLGAALGQSGRRSEALSAYERAAELSPGDVTVLSRLAFAAFGAGDRPRAARELEAAARASAPGTFAHSGALGILLAETGRESDSLAWLERSVESEAEFAEARYLAARLHAAAGRRDEARRRLAEAIAKAPELAVRAASDSTLSGLR